MLARLIVVALAAAVIVVAVGRLGEERGCKSARAAMAAATYRPGGTAAARSQAARHVRDDCVRSADLASAAALLAAAGQRGEARAIATTAARREPDDFASWVALALATSQDDRAAAARALGRARALNPRWQVPAPLRQPAAGGAGP